MLTESKEEFYWIRWMVFSEHAKHEYSQVPKIPKLIATEKRIVEDWTVGIKSDGLE